MNPSSELIVSVSEFVALLNQTLAFAYPTITIAGELTNFRVSKNKWLYFDLKDELASVKFFGTVYQLPGPLEDGMLLQVRGQPQLHPLYGFSVNVQTIQPVGKGSIKRAASLLHAKLEAEGLFDESRKRLLPYPPTRIGLITSGEAAAYSDFIKVLQHRWRGIEIDFIDVQVQGEQAVPQIVRAIEHFNAAAEPPEVLIITRGGGSADDLQAFSNEQVTRSVAGSRTPTIVAIGHERDISLAELVADCRASTPSNAAELLTPDRADVLNQLQITKAQLSHAYTSLVRANREGLVVAAENLHINIGHRLAELKQRLSLKAQLLTAFDPQAALARGYATVRLKGQLVRSGQTLSVNDIVDVRLYDADITALVKSIHKIKDEQ